MKKLLILFALSISQIVSIAQSYSWASTVGTLGRPSSAMMALDDSENTYVLAVDGSSYGSTMAKYTPAGVLVWKQYIAKLANAKIVVDHNSNLLVAGMDGADYSLFRYSPGGTELNKSKILPYVTGGGNTIESIAVDVANNYYITGDFSANFSFGSHALTSDGNKKLYVAKFDASDNCAWLIGSDEGGAMMGLRVAADSYGNTCVSGLYGNSLVIQGKGVIPSNTGAFVARIKADGQVDWIKGLNVELNATTFDQKQNYVFAGQYSSNMQLGPTSLTIAGNDVANLYFAKMDQQGNITEAHQFGSPTIDEVRSISCRSSNVYVCGNYKSQISFGDVTLANSSGNGHTEPFIAQYNSQGKCEWATNTGCVDPGYGLAYGADNVSDNGVYFVGLINGTMNFGGHTQTGNEDVFVAKLANLSVGIDKNLLSESRFAIYPNPVTSFVNMTALINSPGTIHIYMYDYLGRKVYVKEVIHPGGLFIDKADVSSVPSGSYIIELWQNDGQRVSRQFIK